MSEMVMLCEHQIGPRLIVGNGVFTVSYVLALLAALNHFSVFLKLGKLSSIYAIIILLTGDLIKAKYSGARAHYVLPKLDIRKSIELVIMSVVSFFGIAVLYGAPVLSEHEETLMFAIIMTTFTTCHSIIHLGVKGSLGVFGELSNFSTGVSLSDVILRNVQFTLIGAWASAVVIPLDWARAWQEWPIPCCVGAIMGFLVGHLLSICFLVLSKFLNSKRTKSYV